MGFKGYWRAALLGAAALALGAFMQVPLQAQEPAPTPDGPTRLLRLLTADGAEIGTYEWPRPGLRVLEPEIGELDPQWRYATNLSDFDISSGMVKVAAEGNRLPEVFAPEVNSGPGEGGLEKKKPVFITVIRTGAEISTGLTPLAEVKDWTVVPGETGPEIAELALGLPAGLQPGDHIMVLLKLTTPLAGVLLPEDALWRQADEPPASYVFEFKGDSIARRKIEPGPSAEGQVEIAEGVLPGEQLLAGDLQELYTRFELGTPVATETPTTAQEVTASGEALKERIWTRFLISWGLIGFVAAGVWLWARNRKKRTR